MPDNRTIPPKRTIDRPSWMRYQEGLKKDAAQKRLLKSISKYTAFFFVLLVLICTITAWPVKTQTDHAPTVDNLTSTKSSVLHTGQKKLIGKEQVQNLLDGKSFLNLKEKSFDYFINGKHLRVDTSLDIPLQSSILDNFNRSTSRYIAIVAIDPSTGKILSMAGFDKENLSDNPCVDNIFPAASIFKIVTATAAIDKCGFHSETELTFNGGKHTLYKSQLKERTNKYTNRITFQDSFAQSVNPVFGKIGALYLGKDLLKQFASSFGFNQHIQFELPLLPSLFSISDEPYQWAEIACGFNRETTMTPLHGALITSTILNQGWLIEPTIVDQIIDEKGQAIYRSDLTTINRAMTSEASMVMKQLMRTTIRYGTCKNEFRGSRNDPILSRLNIGGKSGSIDNKPHDARYDWFVGFAEEKEGPGKIVISVFVAHEKYIGVRASHYARLAMKQHFRSYFAGQ